MKRIQADGGIDRVRAAQSGQVSLAEPGVPLSALVALEGMSEVELHQLAA